MRASWQLAVLLSMVAVAGCRGGDGAPSGQVITISRDAHRFPYTIHPVLITNQRRTVYAGRNFILSDSLGSGRINEVTVVDTGLLGSRRWPNAKDDVWQYNLPPRFAPPENAVLDGAHDVDGDGRRDVVALIPAADRREWLLLALDADTGRVLARHGLAGGEDRRPDGWWDGTYLLAGVDSVPTTAGPVRAFLLLATAGHDLQPRGLLAVAVADGRILWRRTMGAKPSPERFAMLDLDGDGRREILLTTDATNNYGTSSGPPPGGRGDDRPWLLAYRLDGSLLWERDLLGGPGGLFPVPLRDDAGRVVLVVGGNLAPTGAHPPGAVFLLDGATGTVRWRWPVDTALGVARTLPRPDGTLLMFQAQSGEIVRFLWNGRELVPAGRIRADAALSWGCVADVLPPPGPELLLRTGRNELVILDGGNRPLLWSDSFSRERHVSLLVPHGRQPGRAPRVEIPSDRRYNGSGVIVELLPAPAPSPWLPVTAAVVLPVAGAVLVVGRRRRRRHSRLLRRQLLVALQEANHGATGPVKSILDHVSRLQFAAADEASLGRFRERLREGAAALAEGPLPVLREQLAMARLAGLDRHEVGAARAAVARVAALVAETAEASTPAALRRLADDLDAQVRVLSSHLRNLRQEIRRGLRADVAAVQRRVLAAHAAAIAELGVDVTAPLPAVPPVAMDGEDLLFVLENLVGNALRAMRETGRRSLALTWERAGGMVVGRVADTGCGIPRDRWRLILETEYSTREGGGLGLPRSRLKLRACGGRLEIERSSPGEGTVIRLEIPVAEDETAGG